MPTTPDYHSRRFTTYANHFQKCWPGVDPYPITVDKLLRLIHDRAGKMGYYGLYNLIHSQCYHPSHGPSWNAEVARNPKVLAVLEKLKADQEPNRIPKKRGRPLGAKDKKKRIRYGSKKSTSGEKPKNPRREQVRLPDEKHGYECNDAEICSFTSCSSNNPLNLPAIWYPSFDYEQARYPSSIRVLALPTTTSATQHHYHPKYPSNNAFLCHPILRPQYR